MTKSRLAALGLCGLLLLPGCVGRAGPAAVYLQVGRAQPEAKTTGKGLTQVAIGRIAAVEALDRQAVMLARGRVMTPSQQWYWEDTPGRLFERALAGAVNATEGLAAVWPVRWNSQSGIALSGVVTAFAVEEGTRHLNVTLECQLKSGSDGRMLARAFTASVPVAGLEPQVLADAGSQALQTLSAEVAGWIRQSAAEGKQAGSGT